MPGGLTRRRTSTSTFGVSRRESHDASAFYGRFATPDVVDDSVVGTRREVDEIFCHDARQMPELEDRSVALVVTSPPYFAGKEYETELGHDSVPTTYVEYLTMLEEVFAECVRKLEPGGRIAVNIANLGRRPYRSLSADVTTILQDRLRLLMRGEVIWLKSRGATGSCAWGTFQRPNNPVLRDLTERIVVASKGRFDRAISAAKREAMGLPSEASLLKEDFMEATTDVWEIASEKATRVGHPAPFPVDLPRRLIDLYTYRSDLVLDPFMGSGSTAVAALRTGRHYAGYDTDESYIVQAKRRIEAERDRISEEERSRCAHTPVVLPGVSRPSPVDEHFQERASREGWAARELAREALIRSGFTHLRENAKVHGVDISFVATDKKGDTWHFDIAGTFTSYRPGLRRTDALWRALGKAAVLRETKPDVKLVLLTTGVPVSPGPGAAALGVVTGTGKSIHDVIVLHDRDHLDRLRRYGSGQGQ